MSVTFHSLMKKEKDRRQRVKEAKEAKQRLRRKRQPSAQMGKIYRARCDTGAKSAARHSADHQDEQVGKREDNTHEVTRGGFCALSSSQHTEKQQETRVSGLYNLGNTCFMNATLQCLYSISNFQTFILQDKSAQSDHGLIIELKKLFMNMGNAPIITPLEFKTEVGKHMAQFRGYAQQDSQEFLTFLLSNLHETLKQKPEESTNDDNFAMTDPISEQAWKEYLEQGDSMIVKNFHGQLKSILQCSTCKGEQGLDTYDTFMSLPLPVPCASGTAIELSHCFETMTQQQLSTSKNWYCHNCKDMVYLSKRTIISRPPRILIVYLKRFRANSFGTFKVDTMVNFPTDSLELSPFTSTVLCKYKLRSVINHEGSIHGGHYYAISRHGSDWYIINDALVIPLHPDEVQLKLVTHLAFVLFYEYQEL